MKTALQSPTTQEPALIDAMFMELHLPVPPSIATTATPAPSSASVPPSTKESSKEEAKEKEKERGKDKEREKEKEKEKDKEKDKEKEIGKEIFHELAKRVYEAVVTRNQYLEWNSKTPFVKFPQFTSNRNLTQSSDISSGISRKYLTIAINICNSNYSQLIEDSLSLWIIFLKNS